VQKYTYTGKKICKLYKSKIGYEFYVIFHTSCISLQNQFYKCSTEVQFTCFWMGEYLYRGNTVRPLNP